MFAGLAIQKLRGSPRTSVSIAAYLVSIYQYRHMLRECRVGRIIIVTWDTYCSLPYTKMKVIKPQRV